MAENNHDRLSDADLRRAIISYAGQSYPNEDRERAVIECNRMNNLLASPISKTADFFLAVVTLQAKLKVEQPVVPENDRLDKMGRKALEGLADELSIARWDWDRRNAALQQTFSFYESQPANPPEDATAYFNTFIQFANYFRSVKNLPDIPPLA